MKIGIDIRETSGEKAGKGYYALNIVHQLLKLDQKNHYILYSKNPIPGFDQFKNVELRQITGVGLFWHHKVAKDARKSGLNLFFAPTSYIIPALLKKPIKVIFTVHDLVAFLFPNKHNKKATLVERFYLKKAVKNAHAILTVSEHTKKDLIQRFPQAAKKTHTIYNAASKHFKPLTIAKLTDFITRTRLPKDFFLAVGTIIPRKNYLRLLEAFAAFLKEKPHYHLIIVGSPGWNFREVESTIQQLQLHGHVHILGYLSENSLVNLYNLATALVFPSLYEGFGIPLLEAMQCGCPVLAGRTSSIPEVVGDSALLFDPHSSQSIKQSLNKLTSGESLRDTLREAGFLQARKFSWEASAKNLLAIIQDQKS